jgi:hypothetical protein
VPNRVPGADRRTSSAMRRAALSAREPTPSLTIPAPIGNHPPRFVMMIMD